MDVTTRVHKQDNTAYEKKKPQFYSKYGLKIGS